MSTILRKRRKKGVRWYRRELRHIAKIADEALDSPAEEHLSAVMVAIAALASEAAIGREAYLER